jgi:transposase
MPEHVIASEDEIITDGDRRRRASRRTLDEGAGITVVARRNGVAPNLLTSLASPDAESESRGRVRVRR